MPRVRSLGGAQNPRPRAHRPTAAAPADAHTCARARVEWEGGEEGRGRLS